jgi:hypothetical protein
MPPERPHHPAGRGQGVPVCRTAAAIRVSGYFFGFGDSTDTAIPAV